MKTFLKLILLILVAFISIESFAEKTKNTQSFSEKTFLSVSVEPYSIATENFVLNDNLQPPVIVQNFSNCKPENLYVSAVVNSKLSYKTGVRLCLNNSFYKRFITGHNENNFVFTNPKKIYKSKIFPIKLFIK